MRPSRTISKVIIADVHSGVFGASMDSTMHAV